MLTVAQTTQNIWKVTVGKSSLPEAATLAIIQEISDSNLETGRYGPKSGVFRVIWESWQQEAANRAIFNGFHLIHTLFSALVEVRDPLKSSIILKQIKSNHWMRRFKRYMYTTTVGWHKNELAMWIWKQVWN